MSHESRTSPPTYPEILDIHDGAFSESIWGSDGFRTIKVSGQDDVIADSYKDNLTIAAGTNVTLTTNAAGDTLTIAATPGTVYTAGTGISISGSNEISVTAVALTTVQTAANQTAHLALTAQEGDVVVRSDENKSYVKNAGTAGNMSDYTLLATPTDLVLSVAGNTGAVTAAQLKTAYESNAETNAFTDALKSKLEGIEANATADQTQAEIEDIVGAMLDGTETGISVSYDATDNNLDFVVATQTANDFTNTLKNKLDGIETDATADQTNAEIRAAVEAASDSNVFTDADHTKLNAIDVSADVTDATTVDAAGAVMNSDLDVKGELLVGDGSGDPQALSVGTNGYILKADSSTATGLVWSAAGSGGDPNQNAFSTVAVSGQDNVAADTTTDTLTLAAGSNVTITTNASSDTVTIAASNTNTDYMEKTGGTFTGNVRWNDGNQIRLGNDADLQIVHDGSNGTITETTGNLDIRAKNTNGGLVTISDSAGENLIKATAGSSVELTYDGTKKFETTSAGATVTGTLTATLANNSIANAQVADDAIGVAELSATGTASSSTYLRGDNSWATVSGGIPDAGNTVTGAFALDRSQTIKIDAGQYLWLTCDQYLDVDVGQYADIDITQNLQLDVSQYIDINTSQYFDLSATQYIALGTAGTERFRITSTGALAIEGSTNYGSSGQVLTSNGNDAPTWQAAGGGLSSDSEYNTVAGTDAGNSDNWGTDAVRNSLYGYKAGESLTTGDYNVAIGHLALQKDTTGSYNTVVGADALLENVDGGGNTAVGMTCMEKNTSGDSNTAVGKHALWSNQTGSYNTVLGTFAQKVSTAASDNVVIGYNAGDSMTSSTQSVFIGKDAGGGVTSGTYNISIGAESMMAACTGTANVNVGRDGLRAITSGQKNVNVGNDGNRTASTASYCVSVGHEALFNNNQDQNIAIGYQALKANTSGSANTAVGHTALTTCETGAYNTAVGYEALKVATSSSNTALGREALLDVTTGIENTGLGRDSGYSINSGAKNVCVGIAAGGNITTGDNNICIGANTTASAAGVDNEITLGNTSITKFRIPGLGFEIGSGGGALTKAWINFDGTGTVSIRDSYNVSSLTDHAAGVYEVTYTTAMANNDYVVTASAIEDYSSATSRSPRIAGPTRAAPATGSVHIASWATNNSEYDVEECHVHVIGD